MEEHMDKDSKEKSENDAQKNEVLKKEARDIPAGATAMDKINENNPDDVLKSVEDDVKLMRDVFNFLKKKINDIKGKVYPEDCNTVTKREVCAEFDMTNELLSNLHLGGSMTLAALVRALTFLLALRRRNLTWSSNFSLESMIAPSNLTY